MRSANSKSLNIGKQFERMLTDVFEELRKKYPITWERVVDSYEAGNLLRKPDADFKLMMFDNVRGKPFMFWIEAKASGQYQFFGECFRSMIKADQVAKMRLGERAGAYGMYWFHSLITGEIEVWSGKVINEAYPMKRQKLKAYPAHSIAKANLLPFAERIVRDPDGFLESMRRSE